MLSKEELWILEHSVDRAAGGRFCGDSPAMESLVGKKMMAILGRTAWCPDVFFGITMIGRQALKADRILAEASEYVVDVDSWISNHGNYADFDDESRLRLEALLAEVRTIVVQCRRFLAAEK